MAKLSIRGVRKSYGQVDILKGIDIELNDGEFLVLLGPSGCGKSTLLNIVAGLTDLSAGEVRIDERVVNDVHPKDRDIAMVFQSYALYPNMSVAKNMEFGLEMRGIARPAREAAVAKAARLLQIEHLLGRKPGELSGGQRQRVAIGRALVREPKVFLFDEPLSNLDAKLRIEMRTEIKKLHQRLGTTIVYVTHDQVEAMTLASRIAIMRNGLVQQLATPAEIYNRPANMYVAAFVGAPAMNFLRGRIAQQEGRLGVTAEVRSGGGGTPRFLPLHDPAPQIGQWVGRDIVLGIRPEAISIAGTVDSTFPATEIDAEIDVIEPTGADTLAYFTMGGTSAVARVRPQDVAAAGGTTRFALDLSRSCLFDPQTEARLN
ncbi:ABC transporter ATP-binding protein [Dongia sp.]|uniref:ABC transporter ATP-binding protein n=1 Tax=Dongia sp. TaxID=1977262 RepID=UPI0035AE7BAD